MKMPKNEAICDRSVRAEQKPRDSPSPPLAAEAENQERVTSVKIRSARSWGLTARPSPRSAARGLNRQTFIRQAFSLRSRGREKVVAGKPRLDQPLGLSLPFATLRPPAFPG